MARPPITNPDGSPAVERRHTDTPRIVEYERRKGHLHRVVMPESPSLAARLAKPLLVGAVIAGVAAGIALWFVRR